MNKSLPNDSKLSQLVNKWEKESKGVIKQEKMKKQMNQENKKREHFSLLHLQLSDK